MKVAIVFNRQQKNVINLFGQLNKEKIGKKTIQRILNALKKGKHQAIALEGDKELINHLEEFMPRVLKGERPGIVFNVSYGIQGEARYTHVPSILEMVGVPYVASGPMAHSLALDKVVSKTIFRQFELPTADFAVLNDPGFTAPGLHYPLIVKPKNEAVSFGIRVVNNEQELREAARVIFEKFSQPVLAEQYIDGREINVGLLGNDPPEAFPPAEIIFDETGPKIYSYEDKTGRSGREIKVECPAQLSSEKTLEAQELAKKAFQVLGCRDCARVDMRMDTDGNFYILEVNSLPSLGEHGSYTHAAAAVGLDYDALVNRLVEVAVARYFGTPRPPPIDSNKKEPEKQLFQYLTERRDQVEKRLREWVRRSSRTSDPVGLQEARKELKKTLENFKLKPVKLLTDERSVWTWETTKGMKDGTLLIGHLDIPLDPGIPSQGFRRVPDRLYGEGIGSSRGSLVMLEFALGALRNIRRLRHIPLGILFYTDEGQDSRYSREIIQAASSNVKQVLFFRPGVPPHCLVTQRRGQIKYRLVVEGEPRRLGQPGKRLEVARWANAKIEKIIALSSRKQFLAIGLMDFQIRHYPMRLPHFCQAELLLSYLDKTAANEAEKHIARNPGQGRLYMDPGKNIRTPPDEGKKKKSIPLQKIFQKWHRNGKSPSIKNPLSGLPVPAWYPIRWVLSVELGRWPQDLYTPHESINRISLLQRTLLLAQFFAGEKKPAVRKS